MCLGNEGGRLDGLVCDCNLVLLPSSRYRTLPKIQGRNMRPFPVFRGMCEELGYAAFLNSRVSARSDYPIGSLRAWVEPAVLMRQIRFFFSSSGEAVGYYTWAYFSEETAKAYVEGSLLMLNLPEWREGQQLWLLDLVAIPGQARNVLRELLAEMAPGADFRYLRRGRVKYTKITVRNLSRELPTDDVRERG